MAEIGLNLGVTTLELDLQSLVSRPLRERLPLRTTADTGLPYTEVQVIPFVFGRTSVPAVRLNTSGTEWLIADHALQGVDSVRVDDAPTQEFQLLNTSDGVGHEISKLILNGDKDPGVEVAVTVRGLPHPLFGGLLTNPADVIWYILTEISGQAYEFSDFEVFRSECKTQGFDIGGALLNPAQTIWGQIDEIVTSVGGVVSAGIPGFARLYPSPEGV